MTLSLVLSMTFPVLLLDCHRCQTPFKLSADGQTHWQCLGDGAAENQTWCPTATYMDNSTVPDYWQFCYDSECKHKTDMDTDRHCESRDSLEKLVDFYWDRSRMSPRHIAKELKAIGCPFSCHYIDYNIELVYQKSDTTLGPGVLQLTFHLDKDSSWQTIVKDLDYTYDMLASDYGAIFGLLVGLSLIDTVVCFFAALREFFPFKTTKSGMLKAYELTKWLLVTMLIGSLIVSMFSTDFRNLNLYIGQSSGPADDLASFLNPNMDFDKILIKEDFKMKWGSEVSGIRIIY